MGLEGWKRNFLTLNIFFMVIFHYIKNECADLTAACGRREIQLKRDTESALAKVAGVDFFLPENRRFELTACGR